MAEMMIDWVADKLSNYDFIDLYFVISNLIDIPLSEAELCETAYYDSFAANSAEEYFANAQGTVPTGKLVIQMRDT